MALGSFDCNVKTSPLSGFGGVKGASKAHELLVEAVNLKKTEPNLQSLGDFIRTSGSKTE
jgi:hypothetical protein